MRNCAPFASTTFRVSSIVLVPAQNTWSVFDVLQTDPALVPLASSLCRNSGTACKLFKPYLDKGPGVISVI